MPVTVLIASMQLITHQLSLFGQNDGGVVLATAFTFTVGVKLADAKSARSSMSLFINVALATATKEK